MATHQHDFGGYQEVPCTPHLFSQHAFDKSFEVPTTPRRPTKQNESQSSGVLSGKEQNVPSCTPAVSSGSVASSSSDVGTPQDISQEQKVPRTPRAQRMQTIMKTFAEMNKYLSPSCCCAKLTPPSRPVSRRSVEQKRRTSLMTFKAKTKVIKHLFDESDIFD